MTETDSLPLSKSLSDVVYGCQHYKRKCAFVSPCCQKIYTCRFCHDEEENHEIDRFKVTKVECLKCHQQQQVTKCCNACGMEFGLYFCSICKLFDDEDKGQFHCEKCGICRVGGVANFFHCKKCDLCLPLSFEKEHKCVEKASRTNCPVCMEDLHTSRMPSHIPACGHLLHTACYSDMLKTGNYCCPLCNETMVDMGRVWQVLDREMRNTQMPAEYQNMRVQVLCRDCHKEGRTLFHVVGLKCQFCGSFNTCRAAEPENDPRDGATEPDDLVGGAIAAADEPLPGAAGDHNNELIENETADPQ